VFPAGPKPSALRCRHEHAACVRTGFPAAAEAHRELGPEYRDAVVDSFLEKIEARLEERVNARLAELSPPRRRLLPKLSHKAAVAIGVGGAGVWLGLLYYRTWIPGPDWGLWAAFLIGSGASCGAGLARLFRSRRDETPGSQNRNN
jgi:hypothetical protein